MTFELFTKRAYELEEDTLECYVDYSQQYMHLSLADGRAHGLTKTDKVYLENFDVPGVYSQNDQQKITNKSYVYRVSPVDMYTFKIQIQLSDLGNVSASINRPGDKLLGNY